MTTRENKSGKKDSRRWTQMNADTEESPKKSAQISANQRQKNKSTATTQQQENRPQINADERRYKNNKKKSAHISVNPRQKNKPTENPRQEKDEPKKLRINRVDFAYNTRKVLEDLSLDISENEVVAVVGQNGAGKSTLLKIIMGFEKIKKGSIYLDGKEITNKPPYLLNHLGIGYFMQGGQVFPHLSILENLEVCGRYLKKKELKYKIEDMKQYIPLLEKRKLSDQAASLSGGERHQLALGMVLMQDLEVLLLDEPSAGLSPVNVEEMYGILEKVKNEKRLSILLIEQKVTEAVKFSDRVCLLKDRRILKEKKSSELLDIQDIDAFFMGGAEHTQLA
jgi:branched-chain amino acid transport system ATP-binding protein